MKKRRPDVGQSNGSREDQSSFSTQITHSFNAALTRALLHQHYQLQMPSLPAGRLCPPIPNRANYVCWLKELLVQSRKDVHRFAYHEQNSTDYQEVNSHLWQCRGIDIGTGVSAIYPLLLCTKLFAGSDVFSDKCNNNNTEKDHGKCGDCENEEGQCKMKSAGQWRILATDIDPLAIQSARDNIQANGFEDQIHVVQVTDADLSTHTDGSKTCKGSLFAAMDKAKEQSIYQSYNSKDETDLKQTTELAEYPKFDFVMTNPPFYSTIKEATAPRAGDKRSRTDMSTNEGVYTPAAKVFGGNDMDDCEDVEGEEEGGDVGFIAAIMNDSQFFRHHVTWYTSLVAKRSSLDAVLHKLQTLDGIWGNRGQIRTVEFRQGNLDEHCDGAGERRDNPYNTRVRWGIAWTYERAAGRCSTCQVRGGLESFEVCVSLSNNTMPDAEAGDNAKRASEEVVSRLVAYFENLRDYSLKCSQKMRRMIESTVVGNSSNESLRTCVSAVEERFFNCSSTLLPVWDDDQDNINLPYVGHFIIDAFVQCQEKCRDDGSIEVQVTLGMYAHTKIGRSIINKILGPMPGEISRTNRRWRRLLKRQLEAT